MLRCASHRLSLARFWGPADRMPRGLPKRCRCIRNLILEEGQSGKPDCLDRRDPVNPGNPARICKRRQDRSRIRTKRASHWVCSPLWGVYTLCFAPLVLFTIFTICKIKSRICNAIGINPASRETRLLGNPFISWPAPAAPGNQNPNPGNLANRVNPAHDLQETDKADASYASHSESCLLRMPRLSFYLVNERNTSSNVISTVRISSNCHPRPTIVSATAARMSVSIADWI